MASMQAAFIHFITFFILFTNTAFAQTAYANDFVDPDYILAKNFANTTYAAQQTAIAWAQKLSAQGPWSVINKSVTPPSGDIHDYMSWAPYWWPDCSDAGNTTALTAEQIWTTCTYVSRDGQFNPDVRLVNNVGDFQDFAEATFYNALAWVLDTSSYRSTYEANSVRFIRTWFLDSATAMNPNLNYAQMQRGPDGLNGTHTGVLDLKAMAKVTTAVLILRKGKSTAWTTALDNQLIAWTKEYISWLETAEIAIEEKEATNNHGSFYFNQLASLKVLVNDLTGAKSVTNEYFNGIYLGQISSTGEQPLEAARTRPYHYRAYNLAAMITNARLDQYVDSSSTAWNKTTTAGSTIKSALDYAMTISASTSDEDSYASELYPNVAAVASVYGDPDGKYLAYLKTADATFISQPYILWDQPFAENETGGLAPAASSASKAAASAAATAAKSKTTSSKTTSTTSSGAQSFKLNGGSLLSSVVVLVSVAMMFTT